MAKINRSNIIEPIIIVEDDTETDPSSLIDSCNVVSELPPYEGKVTYSDKKLHIESTGVDIVTKLIDDDGMRSQQLSVSDPRLGIRKISFMWFQLVATEMDSQLQNLIFLSWSQVAI